MTAMVYLLCLLTVLGCMVLLDRRFRLVLWRATRRGARVLAAGGAVFLAGGRAGLAAGPARMGDSALMSGIELGPELPLEELVFLVFLCYVTLVVRGLVDLLLGRRRQSPARREES